MLSPAEPIGYAAVPVSSRCVAPMEGGLSFTFTVVDPRSDLKVPIEVQAPLPISPFDLSDVEIEVRLS